MKLKRVISGFLSRARSYVRSSFHQTRTSFTRRYYYNRSLPKTLLFCLCLDEPLLAALGDTVRRNHSLEGSLNWTLEPTDAGRLKKQVPSTRLATKRNLPLSDKIQDDFLNGNLVQVQGWVLSKTEAQQCAFFSEAIRLKHA